MVVFHSLLISPLVPPHQLPLSQELENKQKNFFSHSSGESQLFNKLTVKNKKILSKPQENPDRQIETMISPKLTLLTWPISPTSQTEGSFLEEH